METLFNIALVVFTGLLAWATFALAKHTKALSNLTKGLVDIEQKRDKREEHEKRIEELKHALQSAETVQRVYPAEFASHLEKPSLFPKESIQAIEILHSLKRHIEDPDTKQALDRLCTVFDSVRREKGAIRINQDQVAKDIKSIQDRIQWSVDSWRTEISSAT